MCFNNNLDVFEWKKICTLQENKPTYFVGLRFAIYETDVNGWEM